MPQYNAPALITTLVGADIILVWQTSAVGNRTITFANLVQSVAALISKNNTVQIIAANTTLDATYQFVVANSGGAFNITLPASNVNGGLKYRIANKGAGLITILRTGGDVINAAGTSGTSTTIAQYHTYDFEADGVDSWFRTG